MVRQDIVAGLRNALERGISIESAKNSLLSAGYSVEDVNEAASSISAGSAISNEPQFVKSPADYVQPSKPNQQSYQAQPQQVQQQSQVQQFPYLQQNQQQPVQQPQTQQFPYVQQPGQVQQQQPVQQFQQIQSRIPTQEGFFARNWKIMLLSSILVILIVLFVLILLFKDKIATAFF
jgi:hypothetical protein